MAEIFHLLGVADENDPDDAMALDFMVILTVHVVY